MQIKNRLSAVSLFSGAGGMDVGFADAGFEILMANDIDRDACATYRLNHGDVIFEGSVVALLPLLGHLEGIDVVFGGPPCQGFSVAGKMDPEDPRSGLTHSFFDAVEAVHPKSFVCENVKALAALDKWKPVRDTLLARARKNYFVELVVLNASDFGVPQNRERMFIVGVEKGEFDGDAAKFAERLAELLEVRKSTPPSIGEIVRGLGPAGNKGNARVCPAKITYARTPVMRKSAYAGMLFNGAGRPLNPNGASSTLPASMGGNKTPIVDEAEIFKGEASFVEAYHSSLMDGKAPRTGIAPRRLRRLTVDECLAIQTFPDGYKLSGSRSAQYRQIGNAVPSRLAHAVASAVSELISGTPTAAAPRIENVDLVAAD